MVAFNTTERPKSAFGDIKIHATTRVHADSIGRWKSILDDNQLQILFDAIGPRRMVELGYAETIQALKQRGIVQRDASVLTGYQLMARRYRLARESDIKQSSTHGYDAPVTHKTAKQRLKELGVRWSSKIRFLFNRLRTAI